jgi:hypothetical protein
MEDQMPLNDTARVELRRDPDADIAANRMNRQGQQPAETDPGPAKSVGFSTESAINGHWLLR